MEREQPIDPKLRKQANEIATVIDNAINPDGGKQFGFALLIFSLDDGDNEPDDRMNYISNAQRDDVIAAMKEFIANNEGRFVPFNPAVRQ